MQLVLSLFPGIGLLDMAFEEEGFCVVRGPDLLWGGEVREFHPPAGKFDGVIGGPPCQAFSRLRNIVIANGYKLADNLIPEFERCVKEAQPAWFLMENVPDAPEPEIEGYWQFDQIIRDVWVGGETRRERRFSFGSRTVIERFEIETLALSSPTPAQAVTCDMRQVPVKLGGSLKVKPNAKGGAWQGHLPRSGKSVGLDEMARLQGIPIKFYDRLREHGAFTASAMKIGIGNGVPLAMGRAVARAVAASHSLTSALHTGK